MNIPIIPKENIVNTEGVKSFKKEVVNLRSAGQVQWRDTRVKKYELPICDRCVSTDIIEIVFLFVCLSLTSVYIQTVIHLIMILCSPIHHLIVIWLLMELTFRESIQ